VGAGDAFYPAFRLADGATAAPRLAVTVGATVVDRLDREVAALPLDLGHFRREPVTAAEETIFQNLLVLPLLLRETHDRLALA
jgi:hypothetical protein